MSFKRAKVVMLPTNEKAHYGDIILTPTNPQKLLIFQHQNCTEFKQHLYIISDEEIKKSDYSIYNDLWVCKILSIIQGEVIIQKISNSEITTVLFSEHRKIIATTDISLVLPQPSQQFIEKYIEEYNKGNVITNILVEYIDNGEEGWNGSNEDGEPVWNEKIELKVNPKDNTITIKKVKDNYSQKEVNELFERYDFEIKRFGILDEFKHNYLKDWKKENL